jgi:hypothetical protein
MKSLRLSNIKNNKGAFEMSMSTLVIIELAVVMLILGLVFVRQIFGTASKSVSIVDEQVRSKLQTMFGETGRNPIVYSTEVSVKPGTDSFSVPFAAQLPDDATRGTTMSQLKYTISVIAGNSNGECGVSTVMGWIVIPANPSAQNSFDSVQPEAAYSDVVLNIPSGTQVCTQRIKINLIYPGGAGTISNYFTLKVTKAGIF